MTTPEKGFDADIALWNPDITHNYGADDLHDNVGYNPYAGTTVKGMPVTVLSRGKIIVDNRAIKVAPGDGNWLPMQTY